MSDIAAELNGMNTLTSREIPREDSPWWKELFYQKGKHFRKTVIFLVSLVHLGILLLSASQIHWEPVTAPPPDRVIDIVDIRELLPPPPVDPVVPPPPREEPQVLHEVLEPATADSVMAVATDPEQAPAAPVASEPDFLPQSQITEIPGIPGKDVLSRIKYPEMAAKMELQGTVFLELYIDQEGRIRHIEVLRDPGNGFAEAAVKALEGIVCTPAKSHGQPVAVRFRYPVRFTLQ